MPPSALPKRDPVATELARHLIDGLVHSGRYSLGERLPSERQLAESFGVGRSAIREALKSLNLLGLIDIRQGSGAYLRATDSEILSNVLDWGLLLGKNQLEELCEMELYIEVAVARLAARRRTQGDLAKLRKIMARAEKEGSPTMVRDIVEFHTILAAATRNRILISLTANMRTLMVAWTSHVVDAGCGRYPGQHEHREIYEAIERGDADAASQAMIDHMVQGSGRLSKTLARDLQLKY